MTLTSRPFQEGDYEKYIQKLTKDNMKEHFVKNFGGWSDSVSKDKLFKVLREGVVKLFFDEDKFVGYVSFNVEPNNSDSILINDIHVVKLYQRKDYGYQILNDTIKYAVKQEIEHLKVFVFKDNYAVSFYKKNGFEVVEDIEKSNSYIMVKAL